MEKRKYFFYASIEVVEEWDLYLWSMEHARIKVRACSLQEAETQASKKAHEFQNWRFLIRDMKYVPNPPEQFGWARQIGF